ncbi:MAG TPA: PepSY domain-containing protein [Dermatophilaceae bacterium]|nr:PepSY domain-containing protein [Dermatophilaceae bacterium]
MAVKRQSRAATAAALLAVVTLLGGCGGTNDTLADHPDPTFGPAISQDDAVRIAGEVTPGDLVEVLQDADRGVLVFDVVTKDADGVLTLTQVAANTGEVLKAEQLLADGRVPSDGGEVAAP